MPQMADRFSHGTDSDYRFYALTPAGQDGSAAEWARQKAGVVPMYQGRISNRARVNGQKSMRYVDIVGKFFHLDSAGTLIAQQPLTLSYGVPLNVAGGAVEVNALAFLRFVTSDVNGASVLSPGNTDAFIEQIRTGYSMI